MLVILAFCAFLRADQVDDLVRGQMEARHLPGLAVTVLRSGKPVKNATYGLANLELRVPVKPETVFEIGSLTKQFTAACILLLEKEGKISVDDRVSKYLENLPPAWSNITVRHLLTHTSGIRSYTGLDGFELTRHLTQQQFIQALSSYPLEFQPGERWKYCNSGYNLLGFIIEHVSGRDYWGFLAAQIFGPAGMTASTNRDPSIVVLNRADGYKWRKSSWLNRDSDLTDVFSAGAIVSTIGDLERWNAALDGETLLSASMKARMWTAATLNNGESAHYGFGWRIGEVEGHKNIGHSGSTAGFSASLQRFPDDQLAVIVLCNSDEPNLSTTLAKRIAPLFFSAR